MLSKDPYACRIFDMHEQYFTIQEQIAVVVSFLVFRGASTNINAYDKPVFCLSVDLPNASKSKQCRCTASPTLTRGSPTSTGSSAPTSKYTRPITRTAFAAACARSSKLAAVAFLSRYVEDLHRELCDCRDSAGL